MQHFIEFEAKPSKDIAPEIVISQVFSLCHNEIVKLNSDKIGVSFPEASASIGRVMRVHGSADSVRSVAAACKNLSDYCKVSDCKDTPSNAAWYTVKRVQPLLSASKIRRLVKRGSISQDEAEKRSSHPPNLNLPYLQLRSTSTSQHFRMFITQAPLENSNDIHLCFNSYGLGGAIPWF